MRRSEEIPKESSVPVKLARLRLLMERRERLAQSLLKTDFDIWALEEFFRARSQ